MTDDAGRRRTTTSHARRNAEGPAEGGEATPPGDGGTDYYLKTPSTRWVQRIQALRAFRRASLRAQGFEAAGCFIQISQAVP